MTARRGWRPARAVVIALMFAGLVVAGRPAQAAKKKKTHAGAHKSSYTEVRGPNSQAA